MTTSSAADADVVIIGGGPAGAAAAIGALRARPESRVVILEKEEIGRDKTCGDALSPHAVRTLAVLGALDTLHGYAPVRRSVLALPDGTTGTADLDVPGYVIPRATFDRRLLETAIDHGATLVRHRVRSTSRRGDSYLFDGVVEAPVVVDASGAAAVMRRLLAGERPPKRHEAVAVRAYATEGPDNGLHIVVDDLNWPTAYAWAFPVRLRDGGVTFNVGYGLNAEKARVGTWSRQRLWERFEELLPGYVVDETTRSGAVLPLSTARAGLGGDRVLFTGDAAHLVNPITGEGIAYALTSGMLAGRAAVINDDPVASYTSDVHHELGAHHRSIRAAAFVLEHSGMRNRLFRAGIKCFEGNNASAVMELLSGAGTVSAALALEGAWAFITDRRR